MTSLLDDAALGVLAAILPGAALADGTGAGVIRPDSDARPLPRRNPPELEHPEPSSPEDAHALRPWRPDEIGLTVLILDTDLRGDASVGHSTHRISPGVVKVSPGGRVRMKLMFYVDVDPIPRPLPFQPPQVGVQWYFTPDGGTPTKTSVSWDPAPVYRGSGFPLELHFDGSVVFEVSQSGWLTLSARIDDPEGAAEFDDTIRILVVT